MKNNKGFTVVELIVTFALAMAIAVFLFQIVIVLKDLYTSYGVKTELLNKQSLISYKINNSFDDKKITSITKCGSYCLNFVYEDNTVNRLFIDKDNRIFEFGTYRVILPEGSYFGDMNIDVYISPIYDTSKNDSLLTIDIPIFNDAVKGENFGIKTVYQYSSLTTNITKVIFDDTASQYGTVLLKGSNQVVANNDVTYTDAGYIIFDKDGQKVVSSAQVTVDSPFTSMSTPYKPGKYDIKYYYKDELGNTVDIKTRTVNVLEALKVQLIGNSIAEVNQNATYTDAGYKVVDGSGTTINIGSYAGCIVTTTNTVDTAVLGTYEVVYVLTRDGVEIFRATRQVLVQIEYNYAFSYNGNYQTFTAPITGTYTIQVWGAQGGSGYSDGSYIGTGGKGGYSTGKKALNAGDKLYIYVGSQGTLGNSSSTYAGGYNGGGTGNYFGGGGGGASDVRTTLGTWSDATSLASRIIVAGGGGGGQAYGTYIAIAGAGGGLTGINGTTNANWGAQSYVSSAGTQSAGGTNSSGWNGAGSLGTGGNYYSNYVGGGGAGYYGGASGANNGGSGAGGSSYIGGVTSGSTIAGNASLPTWDGTSTMTGNSGNGYAKITLRAMEVLPTNADFVYTGSVQSYTVTKTGSYKLEVWGASGGCSLGGAGGYSYSVESLTLGTVLKVVAGGQGICNSGPSTYGGGGGILYTGYGGSGGGASAIGVNNSLFYAIAGGGGGGTTSSGCMPCGGGTGAGGAGAGGNAAGGSGNSWYTTVASGGSAGVGGTGAYAGGATNVNGETGGYSTGGGGGGYGGGGGSYNSPSNGGGTGAGGGGYAKTGGGTTGINTGNGYAKITYVGP